MICIPITATTEKEALKGMEEAAKEADIIELRIDCMKKPRLEKLLKARKKPAIVTCRKKEEGGLFEVNERRRMALLKEAISLGAEYVDIELSSGKEAINGLIQNKGSCRVIVSHHNLKETPSGKELGRIYDEIKKTCCDIIKIATLANDITDNIKLFDIAKKAGKEGRKTIALCMGEKGEISRILYKVFGNYLTYASLADGKESAPGQLTSGMMKDVFRADKLNRSTKICGVIGKPARYSRGIYIFNPAFEKQKLNAAYLRLEVDDVGRFIREFRKLNIGGFAVTTPHKEEIMKHLDEVDETAKKIGAVNTIVAKNGKLKGYNTDCTGAKKALEEKTQLKGRKVVVLGAGGAAKAVAFMLAREGCKLTVLNRTVEKARALAKKLKCGYGAPEDIKHTDYDVLINCTTAGMLPNDKETPVDKKYLKNIVMDIVYKPPVTRLLKEAKDAGCTTIDGLTMLLHQATGQFELWTGRKAPIELMRRTLWKSLSSR